MVKRAVLLLLFLFFVSPFFSYDLEAAESFHLGGMLVGANSSQKTLYISQGESHNVSLLWNKKSKFMSFARGVISSASFIKKYKKHYIRFNCISTKNGVLILEAIELKMES